MMNRLLIAGGMLATLFVTGFTAVDMELTRARGDQVFLELAPVDPRSMIQGDFMRLRYQVGREAGSHRNEEPNRGSLIVVLDDRNVGTFVRFDNQSSLAETEHRLHYRIRDQRVDVGTNSWMFEEGTGDVWNQARYGEFRVLPGGRAVLTGLRGEEMQVLGEPLKAW